MLCRVAHQRLLRKLDHRGILVETYEWIEACLSARTQQVVVDGVASDQSTVISGVPQGTVLGPLLCIVFIDELPDNILYRVRLFADDCTLYREIRRTQDWHTLKIYLNIFSKWEATWGMEFHPQKCNGVAYSRSTPPNDNDYHLKRTVLAHCTSPKCLGVAMSSDLSRNTHIDRITKKANIMIGFLRRNLKVANERTKSDAYRALVRSHPKYCCAVWSPFTASNIKKLVQRRAARYVTNIYHNTSSVTNMLHHLQWESLGAVALTLGLVPRGTVF